MKWNDVRRKIRVAVDKARPVTNAVERVANLAVHLRSGITPMGAVGLASAAVNGLSAALNDTAPGPPSMGCGAACSLDTLVAALVGAGWGVREVDPVEARFVRMERDGSRLTVYRDGDVSADAPFANMVRAALHAHLPRAVRVARHGGMWTDAPAEMHHYATTAGEEIARLIQAHAADGPRCVLLKGRPGTGKTTMAREIADRLNVGRVVFVDASAISDGGASFNSTTSSGSLDRLNALSAAMLVVDDIDKIEAFGCHAVESLRAIAPVVLLTANNGDLDEVIDGAMGRPGRIDEVFAIDAVPFPRESPFDLLTDEEWREVEVWPHASVNELRRRLELRGRAGMRFDDLRARVGRKVRSGMVLA